MWRVSEPRPWLRWYSSGVPEQIGVPEVALTQLLDDAAAEFPRRKALTFLGRSMTYRDLVKAVDTFRGVLPRLGVGPGARGALLMPDCPQDVLAVFGVPGAGGGGRQANPVATASEFAHQLPRRGGPGRVVYDAA